MARALVGTSGFSYPEWRGRFYPAGLSGEEMLAYYGRIFPACEINNTFYRQPAPATLAQWAAAVPPTFRFAIKAHRRITHLKRLRDVDEDLGVLAERLAALRERLGVVLFQLPPSLRYDRGLLEGFLALLRPGVPAAIEFRHDSWRREEVYGLLAEHRVALVAAETDEAAQPREAVGPLAYLRLHRHRYGDEELAERAAWIRGQLAQGRDVYAFFTHEEETPGYDYARQLIGMVGG